MAVVTPSGNAMTGKDASILVHPTPGQTPDQVLIDCSFWSLNRTANILSYASCDSGGKKRKSVGTNDANGQLRGYVDLDGTVHINKIINVGDEVELRLRLGNGTSYYQFVAIISSLGEEHDIDEGGLVQWTADYEADGFVAATAFTP